MWRSVHTAPNRPIAEMLKGLLEEAGIEIVLRPADVPHMGAAGAVELLAPEGKAEEAVEILRAGGFGW